MFVICYDFGCFKGQYMLALFNECMIVFHKCMPLEVKSLGTYVFKKITVCTDVMFVIYYDCGCFKGQCLLAFFNEWLTVLGWMPLKRSLALGNGMYAYSLQCLLM